MAIRAPDRAKNYNYGFIVRISYDSLMAMRPVLKNIFLEFPKMPGNFVLYFDRKTNVRIRCFAQILLLH